MSVTILYQGNPLTFPNINDPDEAYRRLGVTPPALGLQQDLLQRSSYEQQRNQLQQDQQSPASVSNYIPLPEQGVDPDLLSQNPDWLAASKVLYNTTQGKSWDDTTQGQDASQSNEELATFGLDRMARFNYNLPFMGIDALSIKNAPQEEKKAFLYLLDNFERVNHSWAGAGRFAKYAATDPTNYIGLSTLGVGSLAAEGAKLTTVAGVRAALKVGLQGAIEGAAYTSVTNRLEQEARINAGGQEDVNYGQLGTSAVVGAGLGGVLAPLISVAKNHLTAKEVTTAVDKGITRATEGLPPSQEALLPKAQDPLRATATAIDERLGDRWGTSEQPDMFPNAEAASRLSSDVAGSLASLTEGPIRLNTSTAVNTIDDAISQASQTSRRMTGDSTIAGDKTLFGHIPTPEVAEKIGGELGPTYMDLKRLLQDIGSSIHGDEVRGWQALADVTNPLTKAFIKMTPEDAKEIAKTFANSAMTQEEFKGFTNATINAQNTLKNYIDGLLDQRSLALTSDVRAALESKIATAEEVMNPLKMLAKEAGTTSGSTLAMHRQNLFKGLERDKNLDSVLQDMGLDRMLATDEQKADAIQKWFSNMVDSSEKARAMDRVVQLKREIAEAPVTADLADKFSEYAKALEDAKRQVFQGMSLGGKAWEGTNSVIRGVASFLQHSVLSPSSVTVNTVSNALVTFSKPLLAFIGKTDIDSFRQMTATYGAMFRVSSTALAQARLSFITEKSLMTGSDPKWIEGNLRHIEKEGGSGIARFLGRNIVRVWTRLMNASDEFFQVVSYQGFVEGEATARALLSAKSRGLNTQETDKLVKSYVGEVVKRAYTTTPDATTIGILRDTAIKKGYQGDNVKLYIQSQLDKNSNLLKRATDEQGISYTNDLLFKREFSGDNWASQAAKKYEEAVGSMPALKIIGQLFFRTPVRVFEAGMRMTPGIQLITPKFFADLTGKNGLVREVRARGEMLTAYGLTAAVITAFSTGKITGSGFNLQPMERRKLEDAGWRPYSIKVGDKYISYRNYDPVSTPIKIIVNSLERLQNLDYRTAQGELEQKGVMQHVLNSIGLGTAATLRAVQDANLTEGISEIVNLGEALLDPERKENAIRRILQSKIQTLIPNAARKAQRYFGEGQNISNDPSSMDQVLQAIVNPASGSVTHQYDALGFPRSTQTQGFFPYIGIDAAGREARQRGLSERDVGTLNEIAKLTMATGKTFNPDSKFGNIDLKQETSGDGTGATLYNKAMAEYNKVAPEAMAGFFEKMSDRNVPVGRRGQPGPKAEAFQNLHNALWKSSINKLVQTEPKMLQALQDKFKLKDDVYRGNREIAPPVSW